LRKIKITLFHALSALRVKILTVDVQKTTCSLSHTTGNVNGVVRMNINPDTLCNKSPISCSGLGNPEFSLSLFDDNVEANPMFHLKQLKNSFS
jgi:hypothetical protein